MDQGITLHIVISNLVNSINPTFSLGGYPHFFPHGARDKRMGILYSKNMEIEYKNKGRETCSYPLTILLIFNGSRR